MADRPQDQLTSDSSTVEGLLAAVEPCSDALIGISDPKLAAKALPALVGVLQEKQRALTVGIDTLTAEGLRHG